MRDERALPNDRDESSAPQADGSSADLRTDMPAPLSAVPHPADAEDPGMSDEEIAMYRRRVAEGMYNTREVADEVARRMLRRGDI